MIKIKIKEISSPDHTYGVDGDFLIACGAFWVNIYASIGPVDALGADLFSFRFISIEYIKRYLSDNNAMPHRECVIVEELKRENIVSILEGIISEVHADTWEEAARQIDEYGHWEFRYGDI